MSPRDRRRIDFRYHDEIRYWCDHFACTTEQLIDCVNIVGFDVARVARYLGRELGLIRAKRVRTPMSPTR